MEAERRVGRKPRYENEDMSPTTKRELMGWYCYGIAAEVFAICGVGMYLSYHHVTSSELPPFEEVSLILQQISFGNQRSTF